MMIKWTFAFKDTHMAVEVRDQPEDERIDAEINSGQQFLFVPSNGKDAYVNLNQVQLIVREVIDENAKPPEAPVPEVAV